MNKLVAKYFPSLTKKTNKPDVSTVKRKVSAQIGRAVTRLSDR